MVARGTQVERPPVHVDVVANQGDGHVGRPDLGWNAQTPGPRRRANRDPRDDGPIVIRPLTIGSRATALFPVGRGLRLTSVTGRRHPCAYGFWSPRGDESSLCGGSGGVGWGSVGLVGDQGVESLAGEVVEFSALAGGGDDVGGLPAVEVGFAVVRLALQFTVGFGGDPALVVGDAVVDVAVGDRGVAARRVLAVAVAHLDGAAQHPPERAPLGGGDDVVGAVEDERLHL
jgi:hypothetical protein